MLLKLQNISVLSVIFCLELAYDNYIYFLQTLMHLTIFYAYMLIFEFVFTFSMMNTTYSQFFSLFGALLCLLPFGYWAFLNMVIKRVPHPKKIYTPAHFDVHMILYQKIYRNLSSQRTTTGLPLLTLLI